jgi:hypothetical protein
LICFKESLAAAVVFPMRFVLRRNRVEEPKEISKQVSVSCLCHVFIRVWSHNFSLSTHIVAKPIDLEFNMASSKTKGATGCNRFAGRVPAGLEQPVVLKKNGVHHVGDTVFR